MPHTFVPRSVPPKVVAFSSVISKPFTVMLLIFTSNVKFLSGYVSVISMAALPERTPLSLNSQSVTFTVMLLLAVPFG